MDPIRTTTAGPSDRRWYADALGARREPRRVSGPTEGMAALIDALRVVESYMNYIETVVRLEDAPSKTIREIAINKLDGVRRYLAGEVERALCREVAF